MKTKFSILGVITVLLYSCQDKSSVIEDSINPDSIMTAKNIEQQTLQKWFSLNKESDSIIAAAELIIKQQKEMMKTQAESNRTDQKLYKAQLHLDEFKKKVNYIKDYETRTEIFDQSVIHILDSLKADYLQEKLKLEVALCEFQEFNVP